MLSPPLESLLTSSNPQSELESDITPAASRSSSPSSSSSSTRSKSYSYSDSHSESTHKSSKKKTVLVFLGSKSKRTRSLIHHIAQKRKEKKLLKQQRTERIESALSVMANASHVGDDATRRSTYDPKQNTNYRQRSYDHNITKTNYNGNPHKISHKFGHKKHSDDVTMKHSHKYNKQRQNHHKSRSGQLPISQTNATNELQISRSLSKSPKPPAPPRAMTTSASDPNNYNNGCCPYCRTDAPLLDFITASNRHSHLTELRDKLAVIENVAAVLKQEIIAIQGVNMSGSESVSNPFIESVKPNSYLISNLNSEQQRAYRLLTTQKKITFPIRGTAVISPQENIGYFDKFKEMRRRFVNQEFFVGLDCVSSTFTVHTKMKNDEKTKQYRQIRSFSSLNGAEFESAKDNVLKIWFLNTRGYFLMSFASETEAVTVLNLINIICANDCYSSSSVANQLIWGSYIDKKGKRMRLYSQKFLCLIKLSVSLYKTHINYSNGEQPSLSINLMESDLSRDKKEIKFSRKDNGDTLLSIKLTSEIERDDFLNLCAEKLGKAIQKQNALSPSLPIQFINQSFDESDSDIEDSEFYDDSYSSAHHTFMTSLRGPPLINMLNSKHKTAKHLNYLQVLNNTPRMYGAGVNKALDRLAKKRPSDIDFIETRFKGNEIKLSAPKNTYQLLDVLGKSMISGARLNNKLYLHKAVWEQNKVMVINYEKKLEVFTAILAALDNLFNNNAQSIKHLIANEQVFHEKLTKCEIKLRDAHESLTTFLNKSQQKASNKGAAKLLNKFKDKSRVKVFDNQPLRDLIYKICGHANEMQVWIQYLKKNKKRHHLLLNDIKGITLCMAAFGRLVVNDTKAFLFAYLRRGSKNIYQ